MNLLNKRGAGATPIIWIIGICVVLLTGFFIYDKLTPVPETAFVGACETDADCGVNSICTQGTCIPKAGIEIKQAGINLRAYDFTASSKTQLGGLQYYKWEDNKPGDVTTSTTSATDKVSLTGITSGVTYILHLTNDTVIGFPTKVTIPGETTEDVNIQTYKRSDSASIKFVKGAKDFSNLGGELEFNLTITGANGADSVDYLEYKQNQTDRASLLAGFYFNVATLDANLSISSVSASGTLNRGSTAEPLTTNGKLGSSVSVSLDKTFRQERHKSGALDDYYIFINSQDPITATAEVNGYRPVLLFEEDVVRTGSITFKADASACPANPFSESITVYAFDVGYFQSVKANTRDQLLAGYETDADTPANVGSSDITGPALTCSSIGG
jgi:hypothetical protein